MLFRQNNVADFFKVNISKLPSRFLPVSTACTTMVNDAGPMGLSESAKSGVGINR